jgi:hypothetical protein
MRSYSSSFLIVAVLAALTTLSASSLAQEPFQQKTFPPAAVTPDNLTGHVIVAPRVGLLKPLGSYEAGFSQTDYNGTGPTFGADLSVGISRYVAVAGFFETGNLAAHGSYCPVNGSCKAKTTSFGLGLEYHLVNGASFDPWLRWGVAYRVTNLDFSWPGYARKLDYSGIDWLHLAVGGDFYASRKLGFGPFMSLDLGYYTKRPDSPPAHAQFPDGEFHTYLGVGIRGVFDPMR